MSTITLTGNMFSRSMGVGGFFDLGQAFSNLKQTASSLTTQLNTLKNKIDVASTVATVDTSTQQVSNSESREETKKSSLSLVYEKLDEFIANVDDVDDKVSTKVEELKDDFYSKYSYLKPESEKGFWERVGDGAKALWDGLCDIGNAIANFVVDVVEWCKEHWKELLIGLAFIVVGAILTALTGGAFLPALLVGLKAALISGLISGGFGAVFFTVGAIISGEKISFSDVLKAFGDGFATGFMMGGIFSGASMIFGSGLRLAIAKSPQLASKLLSNGKISEFLLKHMVPAGAKNSFVPSSNISNGYKYDINISRIFGDSTRFQLKWHSIDLRWGTDVNTGNGWTAQLRIGHRFLTTMGTLVRNHKQNITHIPIIPWLIPWPWW